MTIHLPEDLESSIRALVLRGRFASDDELIIEAVRVFLGQQPAHTTPGLGSVEELRDTDAELDKVVDGSSSLILGPASNGPGSNPPLKPIWEQFQEISRSVPESEWDKLPADASEQHDHYIYGTPKRPAR
jgi:Arc/MetJ-type ribon-helix-helix transcriptional regulator